MNNSIEIGTKLTNLSAMVISLYKEMASLECAGQKDFEDFRILVTKVKTLIAQEDEIYEELKEDIKGAYAINNFLFPMGILCLPDELEYIKRQEEASLVTARVGRRINDVVLAAPFTDEEMSEYPEAEEYEELPEDYQEFAEGLMEAEDPQEEFKKETELTLAVENDIINTILSMLASYADNEEFKDIKEGLTYIKYYIAALYPDAEKMLLSSGFKAPSALVWTSYFTGDMQAEPSETVKVLIREYVMDIISNQLDAYYDAADEPEADIKKIKITFTEIILRASMIFFDDGEIRDLKELAEDDLQQLSNEHDINSSLNRVFTSRQVDSSLPLILSLSPNFPGA